MKKVPLSEINDSLSKYLRIAEKEEVIITRYGKPAAVLIGFETDEEWFDYLLENNPRFLKQVESARENLKAGKGIRLEDFQKNLYDEV